MLENIHVKNIALIKEIDINLFNGLNIVTGETGAGKSLIIGSIAVGLGAKVPKNYLKEDTKDALIELTFTNITSDVKSLLKKYEILLDDDRLILQRKYNNGRWINRINFNTVNISILREIGSLLMLIHGQHDNQILLDKKYHIKLLDKFSGEKLESIKLEYEKYYKELISVREDIKKLREKNNNRDKDVDYFSFVLSEIDSINPKLGEDEDLRQEYKELVEIKNSTEYLDNIKYLIDDNISNLLIETINNAKNISKVYPDILEQLNEIEILVSNVSSDVSNVLDSSSYDEETFIKLDTRIDELDMLKRKYGSTIEEVLTYKKEVFDKLDSLVNLDFRIEELESKKSKLEKEIVVLASKISEIRQKNAINMENNIKAILEKINFLQVDFRINIKKCKNYTITGIDEVEFYISTNVGMEVRPLIEVSSGGELSRIMLAIQSVISNLYEVGGIIFDEVDTGISGKTAIMVAKLLKNMAKDKQIICITHLAQIAAARDVHIKIEKGIEEGKTKTTLTMLNEEESEFEIARILGGIEVTDTTIENARELVKMVE